MSFFHLWLVVYLRKFCVSFWLLNNINNTEIKQE